MSIHICGNCGHAEHIFGSGGGARMAAQAGVCLLGELPLDARIREDADGGRPTVVAEPESQRAQLYFATARRTAASWRAGRATGALFFRISWSNRPEGRGCERTRMKGLSIKSDNWIRRMAAAHGMIEPFEAGQVRHANGERIVSYGTSSYGYDVRCANEFKIFTNINSTIVDPKHFDEKSFVDVKADVCLIPPNSFALARTVEYFRIPRSVLTVCLGKSTYARCGIIVNVTPLEPEWKGM